MKKVFCAAVLTLSLSLATIAKADTPGIGFTDPGTTFTNGEWSLGYAFTPNTTITVTGLGAFNPGAYTSSHDVGLYDMSGDLLASTTIAQNAAATNFFSFNSISPVTLSAGTEYEVVEETGSDVYAFFTSGFTVDPKITYDNDVFVSSGVLAFATDSSGVTAADGGAYFGGNFLEGSAATPEPSSLMLLGTGAAGLAGMLRKRFQK